jgi:hypothetical protein
MQIVPFNSIICLHHNDLEGEEGMFIVLMSDSMQALKGDESIISDQPARYKRTLMFRNNQWQNHFQSIRQNLGGDLVDHIAQTYRTKILQVF